MQLTDVRKKKKEPETRLEITDMHFLKVVTGYRMIL
jgi:hypothetical protein